MTRRVCLGIDGQPCRELAESGPRCKRHRLEVERRKRRRGSHKGWRKLRERVLRRDEYRCTCMGCPHCQRSGATKPERCDVNFPLEVDHINEDWTDDRMENLATLCEGCHDAKPRPEPAHNRTRGNLGSLQP